MKVIQKISYLAIESQIWVLIAYFLVPYKKFPLFNRQLIRNFQQEDKYLWIWRFLKGSCVQISDMF